MTWFLNIFYRIYRCCKVGRFRGARQVPPCPQRLSAPEGPGPRECGSGFIPFAPPKNSLWPDLSGERAAQALGRRRERVIEVLDMQLAELKNCDVIAVWDPLGRQISFGRERGDAGVGMGVDGVCEPGRVARRADGGAGDAGGLADGGAVLE